MSVPSPTDGFKPNRTDMKLNVEKSKIWADLGHKVIDRLLSSEFLTFLLVLTLTISALVFMAVRSDMKEVFDYWKMILPVITLYIGYAFGKKSDS